MYLPLRSLPRRFVPEGLDLGRIRRPNALWRSCDDSKCLIVRFDTGVVYVVGEISGHGEEPEKVEEMGEGLVMSFPEGYYLQRDPKQDNTGDTLCVNQAGIDQKAGRGRMRVG